VKQRILKVAIAATAVATFATAAQAGVIFDVDFEAPPYLLGPIHGQDGWDGQFGPVNHVNSTIVHGGSQSLNCIAASRPFEGGAVLGSTDVSLWYLETWAYIQPFEHYGTELRLDFQSVTSTPELLRRHELRP